MEPKQELQKAREELAKGLDAKLHDMPERRAIRAIERAILAMTTEENDREPLEPAKPPKTHVEIKFPGGSAVRLHLTYTRLTALASEEKGKPITTPELMEFIGKNRPLDSDLEKAKINVTSSLSKDKKFKSVPWENGAAWWWSDREIPKKEQPFQSIFPDE